MNQQIDKLTQLISDLLDVSKIQAGKLELRKENFLIEDVVKETVENLQATTKKHTITISSTYKGKVFGDRDRINQVLANFLTNAIKYSPKADRIHVMLEKVDEMALSAYKTLELGLIKNIKQKFSNDFIASMKMTKKPIQALAWGFTFRARNHAP